MTKTMGPELKRISRRRFSILTLATGAALYLGTNPQAPSTSEASSLIQSNHPIDEIQRAIAFYGNSSLSFEEANQLLVPTCRFFGFLDNNDGSVLLRNTFIVRRGALLPADQLVEDYPDTEFNPDELNAVRRFFPFIKGLASSKVFVGLDSDDNPGHKFSVDRNGRQTVKYDWQFEGEGPQVYCQERTTAIDLISVTGHESQHFTSARSFQKVSDRFADALSRNFSQYNGHQIEVRGFTTRVLDNQGETIYITSVQNEDITDALIKWKSSKYIPYIMAGGATPALYTNLKQLFIDANISPKELEGYTRTNKTEACYIKLGGNNLDKGLLALPPHKRAVTAGLVKYIDENLTILPVGTINGCI